MKNFNLFLDEMAAPTKAHREMLWYHGCGEKGIKGILKDKVLKPGNLTDIKSLKMFTPIYNRVYLTPTLQYALVYAFGCNLSCETPRNKEAYLCVVNGQNLNDIVPDEDIFADLMSLVTYDKDRRQVIISNDALSRQAETDSWSKEEIDFTTSFLRYVISNMTPTQQKNSSWMSYGTRTKIGKQLIKKMSDEMKVDIINKTAGHKSIAVEGEVPISQIWKLNTKEYTNIKENSNEFKKYAEQIFGV